MRTHQLFIHGRWQAPAAGQYRDILNPADESVLARVAVADTDDAQLAIEAARSAFDTGSWAQLAGSERARLLLHIAQRIEDNAGHLARLETLNAGKTLGESEGDMANVAATFRYYAALVESDTGRVHTQAPAHVISYAVREPVGVCGLIVPWNYPLLQAAWKIAPALAAGNTLVVKPSSLTPLSAIYLAELLQDLLPAGVFNLLTGPGAVGQYLADSEQVDLISLTGGANAGAQVMRAATGNFKRVALELGGKNPNIVFADADFDVALDQALNAVFFNSGQICSAGSRLLVQDSLYERFVAALAERTQRIRLGNGLRSDTQMGPVVSAAQRDQVLAMIEQARGEGAEVVAGGRVPGGAAFAKGYWLEPTVLAGVTASMRIAQEEIFGPVITVERFSDEAEALRLGNGTPFGLAAGVWTRDIACAQRMVRGLRAGTVWWNDYNAAFAQAPWGGYKASGIGRELSSCGLDEYCELKHVYLNTQPAALNWFGV